MVGNMGYAEKLQKLCALRGLDQTSLAEKLKLSKSSMSRILSGVQEPKIKLAHEMAKVLGVTLDYLVDDEQNIEPTGQMVLVSDDEMSLLKIIRRLGVHEAYNRILMLGTASIGEMGTSPLSGLGSESLNHASSHVESAAVGGSTNPNCRDRHWND